MSTVTVRGLRLVACTISYTHTLRIALGACCSSLHFFYESAFDPNKDSPYDPAHDEAGMALGELTETVHMIIFLVMIAFLVQVCRLAVTVMCTHDSLLVETRCHGTQFRQLLTAGLQGSSLAAKYMAARHTSNTRKRTKTQSPD